jgi:CheY-like chemotaxis protein
MSDRFCMLGRVTSGVAHDLANYLGAADLALTMAERNDDPSAVARALANAREATRRALRLNEALLEYARGGAPAPGPIDLAAAVRGVIELFGRSIPERLSVTVDLEGGLPPVTGVAAELEQLVLNLVLNACEAMPEGGTLSLTVRRVAEGLALGVSDTGRGLGRLPAEGAAVTHSSKTSRPGGGLGLGIVRHVAASHGARVKLAARPGGGTTVLVVFPVDEVGARRSPAPTGAPVGRDVLVVDDDEQTRLLFRELLRSQGFTVHTAENGRAALEWLAAQPQAPACIILDLEMPVMDGWDFMDRLRDRPAVPPVVVVSGATDPPEGAILYLSKPPPFQRLLRAVQACCAEPEPEGRDSAGSVFGPH